MKMTKTLNGGNMTIALEGRLDTMTAPGLETELSKSLGGAESLTLDFSKNMVKKGGMKVLHVNEVVQEVFEVTGFADILTIE